MNDWFYVKREGAGSKAVRERVFSAERPAPRARRQWSRILAAALLAVFATVFAAPAGAQTTNATGKPTISGPPQVDETLTADTGGIADADGLGAFSYQWIRVNQNGRNATVIAGATGGTYTPVAADVDKRIKVKVSFTDGAGNTEEVTSEAWPSVGYPINAITIVAEKTDCPTDSDWCTEMTVGSPPGNSYILYLGYNIGDKYGNWGALSDTDLIHDGTTYTFSRIKLVIRIYGSSFAYLSLKPGRSLPEGTLINLGGHIFTATSEDLYMSPFFWWAAVRESPRFEYRNYLGLRAGPTSGVETTTEAAHNALRRPVSIDYRARAPRVRSAARLPIYLPRSAPAPSAKSTHEAARDIPSC